MLFVSLVTLVLVALRLYGNTSLSFQAIAHTFVGLLGGYWWGTHEWITGVYFILLCGVECYMVASKFFPAISIENLIKK